MSLLSFYSLNGVRKPIDFQGVYKEPSGMKWVKKNTFVPHAIASMKEENYSFNEDLDQLKGHKEFFR